MPGTMQGPPRPHVVERDMAKRAAKEAHRTGILHLACKDWVQLPEERADFLGLSSPFCRAATTVPQRVSAEC